MTPTCISEDNKAGESDLLQGEIHALQLLCELEGDVNDVLVEELGTVLLLELVGAVPATRHPQLVVEQREVAQHPELKVCS